MSSSNSGANASNNSVAYRFDGIETNNPLTAVVKLFKGKSADNTGSFIAIITKLIEHFAEHPIEDDEFDLEDLEVNMNICFEAASQSLLTKPEIPIPKDELAALKLYTSHSDFYRVLNMVLRKADRTALVPFVDIVWMILVALSKCPVYLVNENVYRGVKLDLSQTLVKDAIVTWHQFTSCSTSISALTSDQFTGESGDRSILIIQITSTRARDISEYSLYPQEREVIFPPNTRFRVLDKGVFGGKLIQYQLIELPSFDPIYKYGEPLEDYKKRVRVVDETDAKVADEINRLKLWLSENDIVAVKVTRYATALYDNGIASKIRLQAKLKKDPFFLDSIGFDVDDCEYICENLCVSRISRESSGGSESGKNPSESQKCAAVQKLKVGDQIILNEAVHEIHPDGPLRIGDIGIVMEYYSDANDTFLIQAITGLQQDSVGLYPTDSIRLASSSEVAIALQLFQNCRSFEVGDSVRIVELSLDELILRQQGLSIACDMASMVGKTGVVVGINHQKYCEVSVEGLEDITELSPLLLEYITELIPEVTTPDEPEECTPNSSNALARLCVGDKVTVVADFASHDDAGLGPLVVGSIGEVIKDDNSSKPYHVRAIDSGKTWWYVQTALKKYIELKVGELVTIAQGIEAPASGPLAQGQIGEIVDINLNKRIARVSANGKMQWYDVDLLITATTNSRASFLFSVGQRVLIRSCFVEEAKAIMQSHGGWSVDRNIMLGKVGTITKVEPNGNCNVVCDYSCIPKLWSPDMLILLKEATGRLAVGEYVRLTVNYAQEEDAFEGPMKPGDVGVLILDDKSSKPFQVEFSSKKWWYLPSAICRARENPTPIAVKSRVRIKQLSSSDALDAMLGRDAYTADRNIMLGKVGTVTSVDLNGDCEVKADGGSRPRKFNPLMLELLPVDYPISSTSLVIGNLVEVRQMSIAEATDAMYCIGFGPEKAAQLGAQGWIIDIDNNGDCEVAFEGSPSTSVWHPFLLNYIAASYVPPSPSKSRIQVNQRVRLVRGYESIADAADGPMKLGDIGMVVTDDGGNSKPYKVVFESKPWWYEAEALEIAEDSNRRIKVGDCVQLSPIFQSCGDAAEGPLKVGEIGTVIFADKSSKPFQVKTKCGIAWWYQESALVQVARRFQIGNQVCIRSVSADDMRAAQISHGGFEDARLRCIGSVGVVTQVGQSGDCLVALASGTHIWNPDLLELIKYRLEVGDRVGLTAQYAECDDAACGPLTTSSEGVLITDDLSEKPYQVKSKDGKVWWYSIGALYFVKT